MTFMSGIGLFTNSAFYYFFNAHLQNISSRRQRQTSVHSPSHVSVLRSDDVDDDFLVEVGEHALERPVHIVSQRCVSQRTACGMKA